MERVKARRYEGKDAGDSDKEEEIGVVLAGINNLTIETARTEEEAAEQLEEALEMEVWDTGEGEEGGDGT